MEGLGGGYHVHCLRVVGEEISDAPELLNVVLGVGLERMHHVWELHAVPHKEDWEVISHQVPIAFPTGEYGLIKLQVG